MVDVARRDAIRRAHTATHLLHWALHQVLGEHAKQAGSLVDEDVLRFDFSHPRAMSAEELRRVEDLVYAKILGDAPVTIRDMSLDEARKEGYTALFGEKYGEWVRTVNIGGGECDVAFSRELCGGTHLQRTGQVGFFKIVAESSVAAGIRRIEAVTGLKAADWARAQAGHRARPVRRLQSARRGSARARGEPAARAERGATAHQRTEGEGGGRRRRRRARKWKRSTA